MVNIDVNKPVTNPDLLAAIDALQNNTTAETEAFFISELKKWRDEQNEQTIISTYDDLSSMVIKDSTHSGFVLNPYGCNIMITRNMIEHFNNSSNYAIPYTLEKETKVMIGTPANYSHELTKAISDYLKTKKNVKSAYLALMQKDDESSFLVIVDFTGDRRETFDGIASVAVPLLKKDELIDMVPLDDGIGQSVANDHAPFYKRKLLGLF